MGKRRATSEAGEESQEPEEEKPLARRTSKRERTKPQAYSPTNQDAETKLRRQALKLQVAPPMRFYPWTLASVPCHHLTA